MCAFKYNDIIRKRVCVLTLDKDTCEILDSSGPILEHKLPSDETLCMAYVSDTINWH